MSSSGVVSSEVHQDSLFLDAVRVLDDEDEEETESGKFRLFSCHCHGFKFQPSFLLVGVTTAFTALTEPPLTLEIGTECFFKNLY